LFSVDKKYLDPVLVSSVDGVGTKLKVAFEMKMHHTVGGDLVNHCVNDIAVQGAAPCFLWTTWRRHTRPQVAEKVVGGLADACKHNGCALIGGETAEMPGFYPEGEYDLAGFYRRRRRARSHHQRQGRAGWRLRPRPASNGLHTNGYSLAANCCLRSQVTRSKPLSAKSRTSRQRAHAHHRSYWSIIRKLIAGDCVAALAHITGAASPRICRECCPKHLGRDRTRTWPVLPILSICRNSATSPRKRCSAPSIWALEC